MKKCFCQYYVNDGTNGLTPAQPRPTTDSTRKPNPHHRVPRYILRRESLCWYLVSGIRSGIRRHLRRVRICPDSWFLVRSSDPENKGRVQPLRESLNDENSPPICFCSRRKQVGLRRGMMTDMWFTTHWWRYLARSSGQFSLVGSSEALRHLASRRAYIKDVSQSIPLEITLDTDSYTTGLTPEYSVARRALAFLQYGHQLFENTTMVFPATAFCSDE